MTQAALLALLVFLMSAEGWIEILDRDPEDAVQRQADPAKDVGPPPPPGGEEGGGGVEKKTMRRR